MSLPHFVIIGAMKGGSTSLFRWLGEHPNVVLPDQKEPEFFASDRQWERGLSWYESLFPELDAGKVTGEGSVRYTDPRVSARAARRMHALVPTVRLIFLARDPVERLRSHYRHEVQRGRERRPLNAALAGAGDPYVRCSLYTSALRPWFDRFPREQLLIVPFEALVGEGSGWKDVLSFLRLSEIPRPVETHNATKGKRGFSPLMRRLYDRGLARYERRVPRWVKGVVKPLLFRRDEAYERLLATSEDPIEPELVRALESDFASFKELVGSAVES